MDVRDVALAHIIALENSKSNGERIILSNTELWTKDVSKILRESGYNAPKFTVSILGARLMSYLVSDLKSIRRFLGKKMTKNSSKAEDILGIKYRDIKESILDEAKSLQKFGFA